MRNKLWRKLLGAVLCLAVLCSALPVAAAAEELFAGLQTGSEAGKLAFETAGDMPWFQDSSLLDRTAYRSGNTLRNETSSQLTASVEGPCWIAFDYAYSSETNYDFFRVFVDGAEVQFDGEYTYTGEDGNQAVTFGKTGDPGVRDTSELQWRFGQIELSGEGSHRVTWSYEKDMYSRGGLDAAWVANVRTLSVQDTGTEHPTYQNLELQVPSISIRYDGEGGSVTAAGDFGVSGDIAPYTIYPFSRWKEEDASDNRPTVTMTAVPKEGYIFEGWVSEDGTELYAREADCTFWVGGDFDPAARFTKADTEVSILNTEGISFVNDETYPWQRDDSFSGKLAFHSGNQGMDDTSSVLTAKVTAEADSYLVFDWAASSERTWDCLKVSVDGEDPVKLACDEALAPENMVWEIKQIFIPAGTHQVTFSFVKDSSSAEGFDAAWIANPRLISEPEECEIIFQFAAEGGTVTGGPAGSGNLIEQGKAYSALKYDELPLCKAEAAEGYTFLGWWFNGVYQEDLGTSSFYLTPERDYQIEARFLPNSVRPQILLTSGGEPPVDCSFQDWVIPHDVSDTERRYTFTVTDQPGFLTTAVVDGKKVSLEMEHEFSLQGIEASKDIVFTTAREGYADVVRTVRLQAQKTLAQQEAGVDSIVSTELSFPWQRDQEGRFYADGAVNNTGSSRLYTMAVTVTGNGVLKFQYETSCRTSSYLYYRTGEPLEGISSSQQKKADNYGERSNFKGVHAKTPREIKIENKTETEQTTVYFSYYRVSSNTSVNEDKVWLSDVEFIRQGLPRDLTVGIDGAGYGSVSASTGTESHEFTQEGASVWQVKTSSTVTLTAVPSEQGEFYGWFDENGSLISSSPVYSYFVLEDFGLKAKFAAAGSYTARSGNRFYPTIQEAVTGAADSQVVLLKDYVLEEDLSIPSGVTLLLPCSLDDTGYLEKTGYNPDGTETSPTTGVSPKAKLFRTLTVPEGVTLSVEGTVLVNAVTGRPGAGHFDMDVTGGYGQIDLYGEIQVLSGGVLDVCGYVKGDGTVTARPGGEVRDLYVVRNWRGGSQAFEIFPDVYPMNQADMHNITAETRVEAGGSLVGTVKMYASGSYYYTRFPQVDSQNGLIRLKEGGAVVKTYDGESGREKLVLSGGGTVDSSTLEIVGMDLSTAGFLYPIDGDMDFELVSGDWTVNEQLKFMPGAQVLVKSGASLTIAEKTGHDGSLQNQVVFYDSFQPEDPKNTSTTAYPKDRGAAALTLEGGAALTVNGSFAGQILPGQSASAESPVRIVTGENSGFAVSTLEANGYCNGTRELNFAAGLGAEARVMAAGESYLCYYEDGALVVKDRASQSFEKACDALEAAVPPATSLTGEEALTGYAADWARGLIQEEAITVTVEPAEGGYVEPEAGTAEQPAGTDGSFAFAVTLSREGLEPYTTGVKMLAVTASPYSPPPSGGGGGGSVTEEVVTNPDGSQTIIVTDTATGTVTETTKGTDGSTAVKVTQADGSVTESRETASGVKAETEIGADGSVGIEAKVPGTAVENGEVSVETAAGTITLPEAVGGGEISIVLRVEPSAGGIADIWLEIRVNGVPLNDLSGAELRIGLKRLLEKEKPLSLRGANEDAGGAGLLPELVAVEAGRVLPRSYAAGTELVLRGMTGGTLRVEERAAEFGDVPESFWGAGEITFAAARELLRGTGPAEFSPEDPLTRAMLMTVLARIEGIDTQGTPWYEQGLRWAVEAGVSDGSEPHAPITREQLVTMLYRYMGAQPGAAGALSGFADGGTASSWAADALGWAVEQGIVRGKEGGRIDPRGTATRAEAAAMLQRFLLLEA